MSVPSFVRFIEPVLRYLNACCEPVPAREVQEAAAAALGLSIEDKAEILRSGTQAVYRNRVGWAHDRLKRRGYSSSPRRGYWQLTPEGRAYVEANRGPLSEEEIKRIADDSHDTGETEAEGQAVDQADVPLPTESPDDRLEAAIAELRATTRDALLEELGTVSPGRATWAQSFQVWARHWAVAHEPDQRLESALLCFQHSTHSLAHTWLAVTASSWIASRVASAYNRIHGVESAEHRPSMRAGR